MKKKIIILAIAVCIAFVGIFLWWEKSDQTQLSNQLLEETKVDHPELSEYVDDVYKAETTLAASGELVDYASLGLAWKSLADRMKDLGVDNYKDFYQETLNIYNEAIEKTNRKNTLYLVNAGNMEQYLEDYEKAEEYYKEAIFVSPGEWPTYVKLAELYEYKMGKGQEEILAIFDQAKEKVVDMAPLEKVKEQYLERVNNK